ncbi:MAG: DNA-binding response OmpR family regulator, partial [Flavobacteriales bacterium]
MKKKIKILLCEDDSNLGSLLTEYLNAKDFETTLAVDGVEGIRQFKRGNFDFIILDVMMPHKDGFTVASEIREIDRHVPVLFLTAKSMKEDTLAGFKAGADDYMTKPFSMEELMVRINAILRRSAALPEDGEAVTEYSVGEYMFDYNKQRLHREGEEEKLTTKENELLFLLCKHRNGLLERNYALNAIWGDDNYFNGRSMDVYIAKLRKHLKSDPAV